MSEMMRLPLPEPGDADPLDWFPEPAMEPRGLPGTLTETSYQLPENLNLGEWLAIGETLQRMERSVMWWLGDWWRFGQRKYGEMASQASRDMVKDVTGHAYKTVANAASVAEKFEFSRRRENVPFAHHAEVAALPVADAEALLDEVEQAGLNRADLREKVKDRKQVIAVEAALSQPAPAPQLVPPNVRIEQADARRLPLADGTVHLIVTSPPYGVEKAYQDGDILAGDWQLFMLEWLEEAYRVAADGGRLALNVPLDTTLGGFRPTYAQAVQMAEAAGWEYRSSIVWIDDQLGKSTARGSLDSQAAPHVIAGAEMVPLFFKGQWRREPGERSSDLERHEWLEWTNGLWRFPGESSAWEGHPAPYPVRLPYQLVKLLSFPGDVVLDPFCGSGTTALAAATLGREFVGFDRSQAYVESALRRVVRKGRAA